MQNSIGKQKSGSSGDAQRQRIVQSAPGKVGARGLGGVKQHQSVRGGPRKLKSGSNGG